MALITPEKLAASGSEDGTQKAYIQACRTQLQPVFPEVMLTYHVPNGGTRGEQSVAAKAMANLKSMGLVNGVPDICLPVGRLGYSSLYIEFKRPDGKNGLDIEQYDYIVKLTQYGALVAICDNWEHAFDITQMYLSQDMNIKLLLNDKEHFGIPSYRLIDVNCYVERLVKSKKFQNRK